MQDDNHDFDENRYERAIWARIGISSLNIVQPGLGLFRISKARAGMTFFASQVLCLSIVILAYICIDDMTFKAFAIIVSIALLVIAALYVGSIGLTWRHSRIKDYAPRWWSRWYGLVLIGVGFGVTLSLAEPLLQARYRNLYIPSESMMPTLEVGDRFLAKMSNLQQLKHGDVLVTKVGQFEYVKRLVGLPGERIAMKGGAIFINGRAVRQNLISTEEHLKFGQETSVRKLSELLPGEEKSHLVWDMGLTQQDEYPETLLGPDQYFFLGDNRDLSSDSRFGPESGGMGLVSRDRIVGRALFLYWRKATGIGGISL